MTTASDLTDARVLVFFPERQREKKRNEGKHVVLYIWSKLEYPYFITVELYLSEVAGWQAIYVIVVDIGNSSPNFSDYMLLLVSSYNRYSRAEKRIQTVEVQLIEC